MYIKQLEEKKSLLEKYKKYHNKFEYSNEKSKIYGISEQKIKDSKGYEYSAPYFKIYQLSLNLINNAYFYDKNSNELLINDKFINEFETKFKTFDECIEYIKQFIPKNIIENYAFSPAGGQWKKMKSIEIPNSVTFIGEDAFRNIEELKYKGNASGYPWGAKSVIDNKPHYVRYWDDPETRKRGLIYTGEMMNGKPHGKGGYYDRLSGTPHEEGTYYYGKLVSGDRWTSRGERYSPSGDTWNGYGTGVDSEGNVYTGKWIFGHTEEEFDELWHDIN